MARFGVTMARSAVYFMGHGHRGVRGGGCPMFGLNVHFIRFCGMLSPPHPPTHTMARSPAEETGVVDVPSRVPSLNKDGPQSGPRPREDRCSGHGESPPVHRSAPRRNVDWPTHGFSEMHDDVCTPRNHPSVQYFRY